MFLLSSLGVLLVAPAPAPPPSRPAALADCRARERAGEAEPYRCYHVLVRSQPARRPEVERLLRGRLARRARDHTARLALGLLARDRGDPEAEATLREAAGGFHRSGDGRGEAHAWRALVPLLITQRRLPEAEEALAEATRTARAADDDTIQVAVKALAARLAVARSQYDHAWTSVKEAEAATSPQGPLWLQAEIFGAKGAALFGLSRFSEAEESFRRQLDVVRDEGDLHQEADVLYSVALARSRAARGITPETMALVEQSLAAAIRSGNAVAEASARMSLAQDSKRTVAQRIEQIEGALVVLRRTRDIGNTCFALRELARWLQDQAGGADRALRTADEAIRVAREAGDRFHVARGMVRRWHLAQRLWPRERALASAFETLDAIEAVRALQRDEEARARVLSEWVFVYEQVVGFLLAGSGADAERAFQVAERLRAQELLGALDAAGTTVVLGQSRPEHAARKTTLEEIARAQQRLLSAGLTAPDRLGLLKGLEGLEARERTLRDQIASADEGFAAARSPRPATVEEVRRVLAPGQAMLSFVLCRRTQNRMAFERPWVFVLTRDLARVLPLSDEVADPHLSVTGLARLVARRDGSEGEGASRLYQLLLQDALGALPPSITRLVVVPDGALHRVPFDALRPEPGGSPLSERYEVTVVPSASLWLRLRARPHAEGAALLALADPRWESVSVPAIDRQGALWQGRALGSVPRGRREALRALRSLGGDGTLVTGAGATERFLKTGDLRRYAVLHLAAHAVVDDDNPERSAIVLAPGAAEEDGLLQSREIVGLDLDGVIVVLSACRSSSGEVLAGEGPLSLARAFLQAGARAVVGNLWEVRDDEAEGLMTAFYRELGRGRSVAAALAAARRETRLAGAPAAAWAGTVVVGDGDAVIAATVESGRASMVWLAAGLAMAGLVATVAIRRLRRRAWSRS